MSKDLATHLMPNSNLAGLKTSHKTMERSRFGTKMMRRVDINKECMIGMKKSSFADTDIST